MAGQGGGNAGGILLLLIGVLGLVALFSGNLDRLLNAIGGNAGGPAGFAPGAGAGGGYYPSPDPTLPPSAPATPAPRGSGSAAVPL